MSLDPDRGQGLMAVSQENFNQEAEFVIIGSKTYNRLPGSDAWGMGYDDSLFRLLTSGAFDTDFNPEVVKNFKLIGVEDLDGERVPLEGNRIGQRIGHLFRHGGRPG